MLSESDPVPSACPVPGKMHVHHWCEYCYFVVVHRLNRVQLFAVTCTAAGQVSIAFTVSWSLLRLGSIELVTPSSHLILCRALLLLPSIFPSIRIFSNEPALRIRWPEYWSFSFNISPSNQHPGLILRMDWLDLHAIQVFSNTTVQKHQFFSAQLSL